MLLNGINHVALLTNDTNRLPDFYREIFDATVSRDNEAASLEAFVEIRRRLIQRGASDGFVTDFGPVLSVFFRDPDGLEGEVCVANPDAQPGVLNPPGTQASDFAD